jgi:parvulin-like peptidyl-prolyl isomerase
MKTMLGSFYARPLIVYLIAALIVMSSFAAPAEAMFIPAGPGGEASAAQRMSEDRAADLARVQPVLESRIIQQKLVDYGLSPDEAMARVNMLSNAQLHELAARTDAVQAGGHGADLLVDLVIVAVLVVVLVFVLQGRIEVK